MDVSTPPANSDWNASSGITRILNKPVIQEIQRIRVQTDTSGLYTWVFPNDYGTNIIPIISVEVEDNTTNAIWSARITAVNHTSVSVQITKSIPTTVLGVSVLGTASSPQAYVHITAIAP